MQALAEALPALADLVLVGDSLAAGFPSDLLAELLPDTRVFNFGLPGDRTQNTLWRLQAFDLSRLRPRDAVVIVGTNNLGDGEAPEAVVAGIAAVGTRCTDLWPGAMVWIATVPPRVQRPGNREADRLRVNEILRAGAWKPVVDADEALRTGPANVPSLQPDGLHLTLAGYRRLGICVAARLDAARRH